MRRGVGEVEAFVLPPFSVIPDLIRDPVSSFLHL